jgi:cation:H+ antiporter
MFQSLSVSVLLPIFLVTAAVVWVASTHPSTSSELLVDRWHLGQALAGLLLIAIVEHLPEVVIVVSGVLAHHLDLITGNLLGGIATQTVILVAVDAIGVADRPLSYRASSLI